MIHTDILLPTPPMLPHMAALFLDVDGTLLEFASHPSKVASPPALLDLLGKLSAQLDGALALVSGRPLDQLDTLFAPLRLPAAGLHGHQLRYHLDYQTQIPAETSAWLHALHHDAAHLIHRHPGVLIEDKGVGLALHWRNAPNAEADITEFARSRIESLSGYRLQPGDHVLEFIPTGKDKGSAVEAFLQQAPFCGRIPVFVGDDLTDEFGFSAANRLGGWGVIVGQRSDSGARYALPNPNAVHGWLRTNLMEAT